MYRSNVLWWNFSWEIHGIRRKSERFRMEWFAFELWGLKLYMLCPFLVLIISRQWQIKGLEVRLSPSYLCCDKSYVAGIARATRTFLWLRTILFSSLKHSHKEMLWQNIPTGHSASWCSSRLSTSCDASGTRVLTESSFIFTCHWQLDELYIYDV